jgi:diphthamide synthase subunit DPH2
MENLIKEIKQQAFYIQPEDNDIIYVRASNIAQLITEKVVIASESLEKVQANGAVAEELQTMIDKLGIQFANVSKQDLKEYKKGHCETIIKAIDAIELLKKNYT